MFGRQLTNTFPGAAALKLFVFARLQDPLVWLVHPRLPTTSDASDFSLFPQMLVGNDGR